MQSVGEVMAIGRTFTESIQKAFRSLEVGLNGLEQRIDSKNDPDLSRIKKLDMSALRYGTCFRLLKIREAFIQNISIERINKVTGIDPWFLFYIEKISKMTVNNEIRELKKNGYSDIQIASLYNKSEEEVRVERKLKKILPSKGLISFSCS